MADDKKQMTIRLPQEAYKKLDEELIAIESDTKMIQYLVQRYFDDKDIELKSQFMSGCNDTDSNEYGR